MWVPIRWLDSAMIVMGWVVDPTQSMSVSNALEHACDVIHDKKYTLVCYNVVWFKSRNGQNNKSDHMYILKTNHKS